MRSSLASFQNIRRAVPFSSGKAPGRRRTLGALPMPKSKRGGWTTNRKTHFVHNASSPDSGISGMGIIQRTLEGWKDVL